MQGVTIRFTSAVGTKSSGVSSYYLEGDRKYSTDETNYSENGTFVYAAPLTKIYLSNEADCLPENIKFNIFPGFYRKTFLSAPYSFFDAKNAFSIKNKD